MTKRDRKKEEKNRKSKRKIIYKKNKNRTQINEKKRVTEPRWICDEVKIQIAHHLDKNEGNKENKRKEKLIIKFIVIVHYNMN